MRFLPSRRTVRRAEARMARRFLALMAIITVVFAVVLTAHYHYLLNW